MDALTKMRKATAALAGMTDNLDRDLARRRAATAINVARRASTPVDQKVDEQVYDVIKGTVRASITHAELTKAAHAAAADPTTTDAQRTRLAAAILRSQYAHGAGRVRIEQRGSGRVRELKS